MAVVVELRGLSGYAAVHDLQQALVAARAAGRLPDTVLLLEHEATITVGRAQQAIGNILDAGDIPVVTIERGGDVTLHAPGQLVAYPIVQLQGDRQDLRGHLRRLEDAGIAVCTELGIAAARDARNTGVWLPMHDGPARKVMSTGIAVRHWITWHGLALNVDIDLRLFDRINPCGFQASVMTRLRDHRPDCPGVPDLMGPMARHLLAALELPPGSPSDRDRVAEWFVEQPHGLDAHIPEGPP